jgi:phosphoribosylamine--glycine ligase
VRVLVVGSGAREHAIVLALAQDPGVTALACAPGNAGTATVSEQRGVDAADPAAVAALAVDWRADLVVIGPEVPLVAGAADAVRAAGIPCFGPSAAAARIEGSKSFAKEVMAAAGVNTATSVVVDNPAHLDAAFARFTPPYVVKDDGLAAGKGVVVTSDRDTARAHAMTLLDSGHPVLLETYLDGPEASLFCLVDGRTVVPLLPAQDFKRVGDGDTGPNTGGMGAYSPVPGLDTLRVGELVDQVHGPVLRELDRRGVHFNGCLYAGLMLTDDGPRVIEFNARFGDPETQAVLPRLDGDLLDALEHAARGSLAGASLPERADACVTVVVAGRGYPEGSDRGTPIDGIADAEAIEGVFVFHAGTSGPPDAPVTAGGRVLNISATGRDLEEARERAYRAAARIRFDGMQMRSDIGAERAPARG